MLIVVRYSGSRVNILVYVNTLLREPHGGKYALNILIYYTCTGCIIVIVSILVSLCSALSTVLPLFPRTKSGAVGGVYRGCKASVIEILRKKLPLRRFRGPERLSVVVRSWVHFSKFHSRVVVIR